VSVCFFLATRESHLAPNRETMCSNMCPGPCHRKKLDSSHILSP
jgi:hypothetical protein